MYVNTLKGYREELFIIKNKTSSLSDLCNTKNRHSVEPVRVKCLLGIFLILENHWMFRYVGRCST